MPHAHRLRSKPLNEESADAGLDSVAIDRALLVSESVHRENCPLRWADLSWKVPTAIRRQIIRPFQVVVTPTREVSLVIVIVRCHAAILKHAAEIHRSL